MATTTATDTVERHEQYHQRAVDICETVQQRADWQQEHILPEYQDRRPTSQPASLDGHEDYNINRDALAKAVRLLYRAVVIRGFFHTREQRSEQLRLLDTALRLEGEAHDLTSQNALEDKRAFAEEVLELAAEVEEWWS